MPPSRRESIRFVNSHTGGFKFYERTEIKVILDYLRIIHQPDNNDALARIINVPKRGIGDQSIKNLLEEAERNSMSLWKLLVQHCRGVRTAKTTIRKQTEQKINVELIRLVEGIRNRMRSNDGTPINLVEAIQKLINDLHLQDFLEETYTEHESRWANVQEFVNLAAEFMRDKNQSDEEEALPVVQGVQQNVEDDLLARFLANVSLASDKQSDDKDGDGKPLVTISTIHAAKGLEWPVVFIPAVYQGSIPHMRSEDTAEERRLLYVAMTRAKALLYLSFPLHIAAGGSGNSDGGAQLSTFIDCLPLTNFLNKGPAFDRSMMTEISKILRRELPSEQSIYKDLPPMESVEDNQFPVDPRQPQANINGGSSGSGAGAQYTAALNKRRKLQHPTSGNVQIDTDSVDGWSTPYATTMQRSSSFTVPQAGFTTAAAHHANAAAAAAAAATVEKKPSARPPQRGHKMPPAAQQRPAQRSLLDYSYGVTNHDKSKVQDDPADAMPVPSATSAPLPPWKNRPRRQPFYPPPSAKPKAEPAIDPGLAGHKLGSAKLARPVPARGVGEAEQEGGGGAPGGPRKEYACFSSPPGKAAAAAEQPAEQKENAAPAPAEEERARPAASFHATTVTGPLGARGLGVKRPAAPANLGRSGIAPMDRLKKPFKLTVKRP